MIQNTCEQWCIAKNGGGYTQGGVARVKPCIPCLFMISEVSIRCQKIWRLVYCVYPRIPIPNTPLLVRPQLEYASSVWENSVSNATSIKSNRFSGTLHVSPVMIRPYRRTSSVTAMLQKLQWDSLQQRESCSRVLMLCRIRNGLVAIRAAAYTLNQFPSAPEGSKQDMYRFSVIEAHTVRPSFQVQSGCGTLCQ